MARMVPPSFDRNRSSDGEQDLFERLATDPGTKDWIVLHSLDVADHPTQISGEIDFVVVIPGQGVLCLEVKACRSLQRDSGNWYYGRNPKPDSRGPFKQASAAMHAIRNKLAEHYPELGHVLFWSAAVFPYIHFQDKSPEWFPWQVVDRSKYCGKAISFVLLEIIANAKKHLETKPTSKGWYYGKNSLVPYPEQCQIIANFLRSDFEVFESRKSRQFRLDREVKRLTETQYRCLDAMSGNNRAVFHGPAGTGKTYLALEQCKRNYEAGKKTLFLCFNRHLSSWLINETEKYSSLIKTSTLHSYLLKVAGNNVQEVTDSATYWNLTLPSAALNELISNERGDFLFDELIIDEAQDILRPEFVDILDFSLRGGLAGGHWKFFCDLEKQNIFNSFNFLSEWKKTGIFSFAEYSLRTNCRNTPRIALIAQELGELKPKYSDVLRLDDGVSPQLRDFTLKEQQQTLLVETLERLKGEQYAANEIVILSPVSDNKCTAGQLTVEPWKSIIRPFGGNRIDQISFCTIHAFKGLEAPVIIITDIDDLASSDATDLLYVGSTRALDRLILIYNAKLKDIIQERMFSEK